MTKDKQIEEMARDLCGKADCNTCGELMPCFSRFFAKRAVEKGYRKASDVAREIFEEIENAHEECIHIDTSTNKGYFLQTKFEHKLNELNKKYIGEDTNGLAKTEGEGEPPTFLQQKKAEPSEESDPLKAIRDALNEVAETACKTVNSLRELFQDLQTAMEDTE